MTLTFTYTGGAGHDVTIQWYLNGVALVDGVYGDASVSGATTTSLTVEPVTVDFNGSYLAVVTDHTVGCSVETNAVIVDDGCQLAISEQITMSICDLEISEQPEPLIVILEGGTTEISFAYTSTGSGPFTIQWFKDDVLVEDGPTGSGSTISGATTTTLTITDTQLSDDGNYHAVVSDDTFPGCTAQTDPSNVTVTEPPTLETPSAYWRLDEINEPIVDGEGPATDRAEQVVGATLLLMSGDVPGFEDAKGGAVASALFPDGTRSLSTNQTVLLPYTAGNSVSFSVWVKRRTSTEFELPTLTLYLGNFGANGSIEVEFFGDGITTSELYIYVDGPSTSDFIEVNPLTMAEDTWYMWTFVLDAATGLFHFYVDTTLVASTTSPVTFNNSATSGFEIFQGSGSNETLYSQLSLWLGYALTSDDITFLYNSASGRTCCPFA